MAQKQFVQINLTDYAEKQLEPRTVARYQELLIRTNAALGNMKLSAIQPHHLQEFYNNLGEKGVRADIKYRPLPLAAALIKETSKSLEKLGQEVGVAQSVMRSCKHERNVTLQSAEKVAAYFGKPVTEMFEPREDNDYKAEVGTYWQESGRLFTKQDGRPIHPDTITTWFHDFVQRKKLPDVCVHSLRHTNATNSQTSENY